MHEYKGTVVFKMDLKNTKENRKKFEILFCIFSEIAGNYYNFRSSFSNKDFEFFEESTKTIQTKPILFYGKSGYDFEVDLKVFFKPKKSDFEYAMYTLEKIFKNAGAEIPFKNLSLKDFISFTAIFNLKDLCIIEKTIQEISGYLNCMSLEKDRIINETKILNSPLNISFNAFTLNNFYEKDIYFDFETIPGIQLFLDSIINRENYGLDNELISKLSKDVYDSIHLILNESNENCLKENLLCLTSFVFRQHNLTGFFEFSYFNKYIYEDFGDIYFSNYSGDIFNLTKIFKDLKIQIENYIQL